MGSLETSSQQIKSFWQRPEGTAGKITLAVLAAGAGVAVYSFYAVIVASLVTVLANTVYAGILLAVIVGAVTLVSSGQFRALISFGFKGLMQALFAMDPIMVIEGYIQTMYKNLNSMEEQIIKLRKQMQSLQQVMDTNNKERVHSLQIAKQCKPGESEFRLQTANAGRLEASNAEIKKSYVQLELAYKTLLSMKEKAETLIKDFSSQVNIQKRQRAALRASTGAFRSAMLVIKGDPEQKYIADQAMENLANQIGEQLGEMDHFMEMSVTIMRNAELQNAVDQEAGIKMLNEWSKSPSLLLGSEKAVLVSAANNPDISLNGGDEPVKAVSKNSYNDLFDKH